FDLFFAGLVWLSQLLMCLTLGLLLNPSELVPIIVPGLIISVAMILFTRPISVFVCLLPFRKMGIKDKVYVSWVGLRGAVPIIFAIVVLASDVPHARLIFNIVFLCTLISLIIQGTSLAKVAQWLGLADAPTSLYNLKEFDIEYSDEIKSVTKEVTLSAKALTNGNHLMDLSIPENTLVVMVKRDDKYFVPTGKTTLQEN